MAAGNNLTTAGYGDSLSSPQLARLELGISTAKLNRDIAGHPVIASLLMQALGVTGAVSERTGIIAHGASKMSATSEGSAASATNYSVANVTCSPARYAFTRVASDDFSAAMNGVPLVGVDLSMVPVDGPGADSYAVNLMVAEAMPIVLNQAVDLVMAQLTNGTVTTGTSGAALTWAHLAALSVRLRHAGVSGPLLGVLSLRQVRDLLDDTSSVAGAQTQSDFLRDMWDGGSAGGALIGRWSGIDWYMNAELDDDGTDVTGGVISMQALKMAHKNVPLSISNSGLVLNQGLFTVQATQGVGTGLVTCNYTTHLGVATAQAGAMAKITSRVS
jgi:hypothetical protein